MTSADEASAAALRALAADVETLGRRVTDVEAATQKASESAAGAQRAVVRVVEMIDKAGDKPVGDEPEKADTGTGAAEPLPPWLVGEDADDASQDLDELTGWLCAVYLHYHGAEKLGDCWMWHPGVIAELIALRNGWTAAHYGPRASATAVMDWHDRFRPGAVTRINRELEDCHLERHCSGGDRAYRPARAPGVDLADDLAAWWARTHGSSAAPSPTPAMMAAARAAFDARTRY